MWRGPLFKVIESRPIGNEGVLCEGTYIYTMQLETALSNTLGQTN